MGQKYFMADALTGGTERALDYPGVATLTTGDKAVVCVDGEARFFVYSSTGTAAEQVSTSPFIIRPDDYSTGGNWVEQVLPGSSITIYPQSQELLNIGLAATVGSNALTVALKGSDGNDPSASNPVTIQFRSATLTSGTPTTVNVTSALSVVLSNGSSLGFVANEAGRIYVWAINNAGTAELALSRTADIFPEGCLVTTTAEGGGGAADSASVMYSAIARSNVICRCIGYVEITSGSTAGQWNHAPTGVQVMGTGIKRTGETVQTVSLYTGEVASGSTATPGDDTVPLYTEGNLFLTAPTVTFSSLINKCRVEVILHISAEISSNTRMLTAAIYDGQVCLGTSFLVGSSNVGDLQIMTINSELIVGSVGTATKTLTVRCGANGGYLVTMNGLNGARKHGGALKSGIRITEIMA